MTIRTIAVVLLLLASPAQAGTLDNLAATVVYLYTDTVERAKIDGAEYEIGIRTPGSEKFVAKTSRRSGTGFFVARSNDLFLITAKHVVVELTPESIATIAGPNGRPVRFSLADLTGWRSALRWNIHPTADVAVVRLKPAAHVLPHLVGHFLDIEVLQAGTKQPSRDVSLTVVGFPLQIGAEGHFSPLSRETHLASGLVTITDGSTVLLLQDPSVAGYSGAPVFDTGKPLFDGGGLTFREATLACVGIISATVPDDTGGKLGVVVPASIVLETLAPLAASPD